ncbi:hypothetical protein [Lacipirellula parvula]|uniref:GH16 domain-containing protein n=1 Tax=Lacipirellula parvula TaxID=2650471 RepID=A0A5K7XA71_9BACT|nr:hypothetical protein [Lacipirellula parvula]BBO31333.1 hypothetical protein PLANPX_0945 [Lacipirellula parvula]
MSRKFALRSLALLTAVVALGLFVKTESVSRGATLQFAGRTWTIKQSNSPVGPGPNRFSASPNNVWSDAAGLHLTIRKTGSLWYSTEVILNESFGYGTYMFQTTSRQDILNANATFGAFTWDTAGGDTIPDNPNREIDFEDGRWGNAADPTSSQVVVQPYYLANNLKRITLPDLSEDAALTRFFIWSPGKVEFYSLRGHYSPTDFPAESVLHHYVYVANGTSRRVPTPGAENFRFNLWLFQSTAPAGDQPVEVVVNDFAYLPLLPGDFNNDGVVDDLDLTKWQADFGQNRLSDANADGVTDGADFLIWQRSAGASLAATSGAVPEPTAAVQLLAASLAGVWLHRTRR